MGNCNKKYEDEDENNHNYNKHKQKQLVKMFSKNNNITYEGELDKNGCYCGYGILYDSKNNRIFDGIFVNNEFISGYIKHFETYCKLTRIDYYKDGEFIRELY